MLLGMGKEGGKEWVRGGRKGSRRYLVRIGNKIFRGKYWGNFLLLKKYNKLFYYITIKQCGPLGASQCIPLKSAEVRAGMKQRGLFVCVILCTPRDIPCPGKI